MSKKEIMSKPLWTTQDIQNYFEIGRTKASEIKIKALYEFGGTIDLFPQLVRRDSVLLSVGIDKTEEIELLNQLK